MANRHQVKQFQQGWNRFNKEFKLHYKPLKVDGVTGKKTRTAIKKARYYLGVGSHKWSRNSGEITEELLLTLHDPFRRVKGYNRVKNRARRRTASKRRAARIKRFNDMKPHVHGGVGVFDGRQCGSLLIPWLRKARSRGWKGILVSGFRTPEYSESLCYHMCGRPSCPGRCAGRATNHAKLAYPGPAGDVSYYIEFGWYMRRLGSIFHNVLPYDRVHFSQSGA